MNATITNTTVADARAAFAEYKALKTAGGDYTDVATNLTILLDRLVVDHTGFAGTFLDLVEAQKNHGYRPTFRESGNDAVRVLADVYDYCAAARGLEPSYRPEAGLPFVDPVEPTFHLLKDFGVYKSLLVKNFSDNDRGPEHDEARHLLTRRTQRYTPSELEVLFDYLWTAHDDCVSENPEDYTALEVYNARRKIENGEAAKNLLEAKFGGE